MRKLEMDGAVQKDLLGFNCTYEYLVEELQMHTTQMAKLSQRDMDFVEYLKAIGGPENLKPAGVFKPTKDLKDVIRRGIPVAYRSLVWQKVSLSSMERLRHPSNYYQSLFGRLSEVNERVKSDIEKDVDR